MNLSIEERLNSIKSLKQSLTTAYKYHQEHKQWVPFVQTFADQPLYQQEIVTVAHNVLTDRFATKPYKNHVIYSEERYASILKDTGEMHPHVASFNEVTIVFYEMLKGCEWAQKDYWISNFSFQEKKGFGNILITKMKPICFETISVNKLPRNIETAFFHLKNKKNENIIISFSSVHLIALSTNGKKRIQELTDLKKDLSKFDKFVDDHILQGDMNFHSQQQNEILPKLELKDAWLQLYKLEENPGYTFDTHYNEMINQIWWGFEGRRMRLDRIFFSRNVLEVKEMQVIFDKPIYGEKKEVARNGFFKGGLSFLSDTIFSHNLFRQKEKYLFKSDHFGLRASLKLK